jgi:hypothetical protein
VFRRLIPATLLAGSILISCPALSFAQSRTVKLNENAFAFAKELITQGRAVVDKKNSWRDHHPMTEAENEFIQVQGFAEYRKWYLGIDETHAEDTKARYKFPLRRFQQYPSLCVACGKKPGPSVRLFGYRKCCHSANGNY